MDEFVKIANGRALYAEPDRIWIANGMSIYVIDYNGKKKSQVYTIGTLLERILGKFRILRQGLRIGIHHLLPLKNGNLLVVAKKIVQIIDGDSGFINKYISRFLR